MTACVGGSGGTPPIDFTSSERPPRVRIIVRNFNFSDVRLYALRQTGRELLGTVVGKQDAEFQLDWPLPERMSIQINMIAGPRCVTDELLVDPGDILELQVAVRFDETVNCR